MKYLKLILVLFVFLTSCQNRNHVTHNKRKYRKGYYKPSRAKVKHKKSNKEEEYAYEKKSTRSKNTQTKTKAEDPAQEPQKTVEQKDADNNPNHSKPNSSNDLKDVGKLDDFHQEDEEYNSKRSDDNNTASQETIEEEENEKPKKTNWMYWLSLAFIPLGIFAFFGGLLLFSVGIWLVAIVLSVFFFMMVFGMLMNIKNIKDTKGDESRTFLRKSSFALLVIFSLMLGFALLIVLLLAFGSY